ATRSEPQGSRGIVVTIAADLRDIVGEFELSVAIDECLFRLLALRDIDDDANHPLWAPIPMVRNEAACLDPPHSTAWKRNAVIHAVLDLPLLERLAATSLQPLSILWVYTGQPLAARDFGGSLRKAVDGCIALGNVQHLRVDIIRVATNEAGSSRERKL